MVQPGLQNVISSWTSVIIFLLWQKLSVEIILEERCLFYSFSDIVYEFGDFFLVEKKALVLERNVKK